MGWFSEPDPPPATDVVGAAEQTGQSSKEVTAAQNYANRPDQTTPWGQEKWTQSQVWDPGSQTYVTKWNQTQTLRPELQNALDTEVAQTQYRSGLARDLMGRMAGGLKEAPSFDEFGDIGALRDESTDYAYDAQTSRLDPQWQEAEEGKEIALRNQGLRPGTPAYDRAMESLQRSKTDAYGQARAQAQAEGRAETGLSAQIRQQQIAEYLQERGVPINEVNALMTGQQVQSPQMPNFQSASKSAPVDYLGAATAAYDQSMDAFSINQAGKNSKMGGMMNLAGSLGSAAIMCDRRLKRDIKRIGSIFGYPLYSFNYIWGEPAIGPMADEVNQEAVVNWHGFDVVNLDKLEPARGS